MLKPEQRWQAVQEHDSRQDGKFFYGVVTTGVYCKPSCGSRRPLRENVRFYDTAEQAAEDGLRPCKRCHPESPASLAATELAVQQACRYLKAHPATPPKLAELAARAGMSAAHFHRSFKRLTGVTAKAYADKLRMDDLKRGLKQGGDVTAHIYASGFGSNSRVYERSNTQLGMTPAQYSKGGEGVTITYTSMASPLGRMMLGATDRGLCFLQFGETHSGLHKLLEKEYPFANLKPMTAPCHPDFQGWMDALERYLSGTEISLALPVDVRATAFQLRVWNYLNSIPYGEVRSYSEVAAALGQPKASRAVASACAANNVALLVPCHRVLRNNGELGGYRWGLGRKRALLDLERAANTGPPSPFVH
jgi:AraC family transcriptional regulator, regulatory protein of adaptative response / methylated-DNA-[protein]-cysteine methyltransferase